MGKSRRNRAKGGQRADPIAKPIKSPSDPELVALREKSILPVLKDLQSSEPKSHTAAAGAIANIIHDARCRKLLLREKVVHVVLTETLTDASLESRAAGWEILKLLTQNEEADFCVHLYRVDVLTAIEHAAKKATEVLTDSNGAQFSKTSKAERKFTWAIVESITYIISALVETQDEILERIASNEQIVQFLFALISSSLANVEGQNCALSCMMTLSEDNRQFVERILAGENTHCFKHLMAFKLGGGLRSVLACGVLHNIFMVMGWDDSNPGRDEASDAVLIPVLSSALEAFPSSGNLTNGHKTPSPVEILQLALEILASIGTALKDMLEKGGDEKEWTGFDDKIEETMDADDAESASDNEIENEDHEMDDVIPEDMEADMEMVTAADDYPDEASGLDNLPTLKLLIQKAIPEATRISKSKSDDEAVSLIRGYALTTLNNIAWTVSCVDFSEAQNAGLLEAWKPAALAIWQDAVAPVVASDTSDVSLAALVTSLAWAIARTLRDQTPLSGDEHKKFMSLYHASKGIPPENEDPFQSLGVKCIGVLGQLAIDPAPIQLNREIGVFLVTIVASLPETPAADAIEALNQLFDIYGDENHACDKEVFWKDGLLKHFEEMTPKVKAMRKKVDKRTSTELRTRADEVVTNLARFVQYKHKHKL